MQQPTVQPHTTPAPAKPRPGTYVLYRDADRYLAGNPDHTQVCKVLPDPHLPQDKAPLRVLATDEVIRYAPVAYMRPIDPAELMHDIDTAPLDTLGDGRLMTAAGAWLTLQHRQTAAEPTTKALPPARS
ncbi:hypothetical protein ACGF13_38420 [Kitasatospora sp. NPDC048286]|uniref:hypothetical protein n=1 Tax=Kitasatospora sp. NPDC048286 TaxID=3364047 RepID=UPI0037151538